MLKHTKTVQARKTGNAKVFTIPTFFDVKEGQEYSVFQGRDGVIVYAPKLPDIFTDPKYKDIDFSQSEIPIGALSGNEILND
jgi:hypothetical protein